MKHSKGLILAALVAAPAIAFAQPVAHDWEVVIGGNGSATSDFQSPGGGQAGGVFGAGLSLGYYITDNFEIAARQSLGYATTGYWSGSTRVAIDYNFLFDKLVPFVGINGGYAYQNKHLPDSWILSPEAGIKYYIQSKAFLFGMAEYQIPTQGRNVFGNGNWVMTIGIGLNL